MNFRAELFPLESKSIALDNERDVVFARNSIRQMAADLGFRAIDQTRLATVTSELSRNVVKYAGSGRIIVQALEGIRGVGLRLTFEDRGPGIDSIEDAMRNGFSTGGGLGIGLPGSKRLVEEFQIESTHGAGTRVTITKWTG
jgi:serine/threonine-protein kinase RsbT